MLAIGSAKSNQSRNLAPSDSLPSTTVRPQPAVFLQVFAQLTEQFGVFGEFFHEDLAGAVEDGLGVGKTGVGVEEFFGFFFRRQVRVLQQRQRQRLDAGFAGDLRLGAAFLLVGQVEVFEALLGFGILDLGFEFRRQLALFLDAGQHADPALFEIAQVDQALFEIAQLGVVQFAGDFLAIAGDEGHGGAFVEQLDGGRDLRRTDAEFNGNAVFDGCEHGWVGPKKGRMMRNPAGKDNRQWAGYPITPVARQVASSEVWSNLIGRQEVAA